MADRIQIPPDLPIMPVRDMVLFPGAVLPLTAGRESSLALLNSLKGDVKLLGVVTQLDPRIEDPSASDLHSTGTAARVHKWCACPTGTWWFFWKAWSDSKSRK